MLKACGYDEFLSYEDRSGIQERISTLYDRYKNGDQVVPVSQIEQYSREKLTAALAEILEDLAL